LLILISMEVKGTTHSVQPTDTQDLFEVKGLKVAELEFALENKLNVWFYTLRILSRNQG
jgi:hypothetical protein